VLAGSHRRQLSMLNLNLLRTFMTVLEEGTLSAAADKLGLRQPTVSVHIQSLEDSIAGKLFDRRGKGVELTAEGAVVRRKAKELLAFYDKVEMELFAELQRSKSQIRVGAGPIMADHILPHIVARFQQKHPGIDIIVEPSETVSIVKAVLDHTLDLGFVGFPLKSPRLDLLEWMEEELVLIVPRSHPYANRTSIQVPELTQQHFIWHKSASGIKMFVQEELGKNGLDFTAANVNCGEVSTTMSLLSSVNAGLGVAVVPFYSAYSAIQMGMVRSVRIEGVSLVRKLYIAANKHHRRPPMIGEFIEAAKGYGTQGLRSTEGLSFIPTVLEAAIRR